MPQILIKDALILTLDQIDRIFPSGFVQIEDGKIAAVGKMSAFKGGGAEHVIDGRKKAVLPGLISGHTHAALSLLKGLADGFRLDQLVQKRLWPYESALKPDDSYDATRLACLEMIKSGITCFADMHFHMDAVAQAVEQSGIRASLSVAMMDQGGPLTGREALRQNAALVQRWHGKPRGRITCMFGPCTVRLASPELFVKARELADKYQVGLHIHLSEIVEDVEFTTKHFGLRPVEHLAKLGVLKADTLAAHCIHLDAHEIEVLRNTRVSAIHNPTANARTSAGVAPIAQMLKAGVNVGLGIDTSAINNAIDMFLEMKTASLLQGVAGAGEPDALPPETALRMATMNNARALGLESQIGSIERGKSADLIVVNLASPHLTPLTWSPRLNLVSNLVYAANGSDVDSVIIDGQFVMLNRRVLTLDEQEVIEKANDALSRLIAREAIPE